MPSTRLLHVLLGTIALLAVVTTLTTGTVLAAEETPSEGPCDDGADRLDLHDDYTVTYFDGFEEGSTANWTNGVVLPIGTDGAWSLGVVEGERATLGRPVNASEGELVGTVDVGTGGALRLMDANGTNASVTLRNRGRANDAAVELVVRNASGAVETRRSLSTDTGRFFDVRLEWQPTEPVRLTLDSVDAKAAATEVVEVNTTTRPGYYHVQLVGEAYLDEIGIVAPAGGLDGTDGDAGFGGPPDRYDRDTEVENDDESNGQGGVGFFLLVFGLPAALRPYAMARFGEQIDAIGSTTRSSEVEPANWNVLLTRMIGLGMTVVGCVMLLGAL